MSKILLLEHAQSIAEESLTIAQSYNQPLSTLGIKQANALGELIRKQNIDQVVINNQLQCLQTAQMIVGYQSYNPSFLENTSFAPRNYGIFSMASRQEMQNFMHGDGGDFFSSLESRFPNGESIRDVYERVLSGLWSMRNDMSHGKTILFVLDKMILKIMKIYFTHHSLDDYFDITDIEELTLETFNFTVNNKEQ